MKEFEDIFKELEELTKKMQKENEETLKKLQQK